jgi:hypothetical protein
MTIVSIVLIVVGLILLGINFPATLDALSNRGRKPSTRMVVLFLAGLGCLFLGFAL